MYIPFMILPLYSTLSKIDSRYWEAAADLGSTPAQNVLLGYVPLSKAGLSPSVAGVHPVCG